MISDDKNNTNNINSEFNFNNNMNNDSNYNKTNNDNNDYYNNNLNDNKNFTNNTSNNETNEIKNEKNDENESGKKEIVDRGVENEINDKIDLDKNGKTDLEKVEPEPTKIKLGFMVRARGLANVGATCYMNATLQCFYHVKKLSENLINDDKITPSMEITYSYKNLIEHLAGCKNKEKFIMNVNNYNTDDNELKDYFEPNEFKDLISNKNPLFKGIQANDSKDLIIFLLEGMDNELTNRNNNNSPRGIFVGDNLECLKEENFKKVHNSIFSEIFYGFQKSIMECLSCGHKDETYTIFNFLIFPLEKTYNTLNQKNKNNNNNMNNNMLNMYNNMFNMMSYNNYNQQQNFKKFNSPTSINPSTNLNLNNNKDIPRKLTLYDCFKENESEEILSGQNQIYCNTCQKYSDARTKNEIHKAPDVLILIINRGKDNYFKCDLDFPLELDISKFTNNNPISPKNYELIGIISHLGKSSMEGHFIAFCKHFDNNWYLFNDGIVNPVSVNEIYRGTLYIILSE